MGHRLSRIYTRTGDAGETGLGDGSRTGKDNPRIEAIGVIDELNSQLGVLLGHALPTDIREQLLTIQHWLFDLGGELSIPGHSLLDDTGTAKLEAWLDAMNAGLEPLREFILPGGCASAAHSHLARALCRRAERRLVSLQREQTVRPQVLGFVNRLSDYLFVLARHLNRQAGQADILWRRG